ncbi:MAG: hypothetical protein HQL56_17910 [Magnetococcales bacterium]|nr:hypothetical protein [Magnetococcales bacterium]
MNNQTPSQEELGIQSNIGGIMIKPVWLLALLLSQTVTPGIASDDRAVVSDKRLEQMKKARNEGILLAEYRLNNLRRILPKEGIVSLEEYNEIWKKQSEISCRLERFYSKRRSSSESVSENLALMMCLSQASMQYANQLQTFETRWVMNHVAPSSSRKTSEDVEKGGRIVNESSYGDMVRQSDPEYDKQKALATYRLDNLRRIVPDEVKVILDDYNAVINPYNIAYCKVSSYFQGEENLSRIRENGGSVSMWCQSGQLRQYINYLENFERQWVKDHAGPSSPDNSTKSDGADRPVVRDPSQGTASRGIAKPLPECALSHLPKNTEVHLVGNYEGLKPTVRQIPEQSHATRLSEVVVNLPKTPVVLALSAYDPVVWVVRTTPGTEIVGVVLGGYYPQEVLGIESTVPVRKLFFSNAKPGGEGCGKYFSVYKLNEELDRAASLLETLTGKPLTRFHNTPQNRRFVVGKAENLDEKSLQFVAPKDGKDYSDLFSSLPPGQEGLLELVRQGKIRPATDEDMQSWIDAASAKLKHLNPDARVKSAMLVKEWTFTVLEGTILPAGLAGALSRSFIIPKGVPVPKGEGGHNRFYDVASGTCIMASNFSCP